MSLRSLFTLFIQLCGLAILSDFGDLKARPNAQISDSVYNTCVDGLPNPIGIEGPFIYLSYNIHSDFRGYKQTGYQILVSSNLKNLEKGVGDLWDSKQVLSSETSGIVYHGAELKFAQLVFWKVGIWSNKNDKVIWSKPASWTMGIVKADDWKGFWITDPRRIAFERRAYGYHSFDSVSTDVTKSITLDLGSIKSVDSVCLYPIKVGDHERRVFPLRFKLEIAKKEDFSDAQEIGHYVTEDYILHNLILPEFKIPSQKIRYIRLTALKLISQNNKAAFGLSQIEVKSNNKNIAIGSKVKATESVESFPWSSESVVDGLAGSVVNPYANSTLTLRHEFEVKSHLKRALLFASGLGECEATINHVPVADDVLTPGWTNYDQTRLYVSRDITTLLKVGANVCGLDLSNGMFNVQQGRYVKFVSPFKALQVKAQIVLQYEDGSEEIVATNPTWKIHDGATSFANVYGGEDYDARLNMDSWYKPHFDDTLWTNAIVVPHVSATLRGADSSGMPVLNYATLKPVSIKNIENSFIYDLGQNASVIIELQVHGPRGSSVRITPAEIIDSKGLVDRRSVGGGVAYWEYTLKGGNAKEMWKPHSFYQGARYLQVDLKPDASGEKPQIDMLVGRVISSATQPVGSFTCSNELFNQIHTMVRWAQKNNAVSLFTDCPHRERLGWLEQTHLNGPALRYEFNFNPLFNKIASDIRESQSSSGLVPDIAPEYAQFQSGFWESVEWGSASVLVPWQSYQWTADIESLRKAYVSMKKYVDYLSTRTDSHGLIQFGLGDWVDKGPKTAGYAQLTPVAFTGTAYYYYDTVILQKVARILGMLKDADLYAVKSESIRNDINAMYFHSDSGIYAQGSQCAEALALVFGIVPTDQIKHVQEALVKDVVAHDNQFTAGDVGYGTLLRALADAGRSDIVYSVNNQSLLPGYGYMLARGATSLMENWDANLNASLDHFMLGQINEWFYHDLLGIGLDADNVGFKSIIIKPTLLRDIVWVKGSYHAITGLISVEWKKHDGLLDLDVTIPPNTNAKLYIPSMSGSLIQESGVNINKLLGIHVDHYENDALLVQVGSGHYHFLAKLNNQ
jgi:hypothetical protein